MMNLDFKVVWPFWVVYVIVSNILQLVGAKYLFLLKESIFTELGIPYVMSTIDSGQDDLWEPK